VEVTTTELPDLLTPRYCHACGFYTVGGAPAPHGRGGAGRAGGGAQRHRGSKVALAINEKRLDARNAVLEGKLEEEQTQSEMLMERARKNHISIEQLTTEPASQCGNAQKMKNSNMMLERQNKERKVKFEVENSNRAKAKAAIGGLQMGEAAEEWLEKLLKILVGQLDLASSATL
jgi:hypothetical protein